MLILTSTDKVRVVLSATVTTNQLQCVVSYRDIDATTYDADNHALLTNNTTPVDLAASPAAGVKRVVDYISVYNSDTTAKTVSISLNLNGTDFILAKATLAVGEKFEYAEGAGFRVLTVDGAMKSSLNQGVNSPITGFQRAVLGADVTNSNASANSIADVTGLLVAVTSGQRMAFRFVVRYTSAATTTGSRWTITAPAATELIYRSEYSLTTTSRTFNEGLTANDLPAASNASSAATTGNLAVVEGIILPSASGNVQLRFASEISNSAIVAKAGSYVDYGVI
jgi:hypothetical protein